MSANCQLCLASWIYFHKIRMRIFYIGFFFENGIHWVWGHAPIRKVQAWGLEFESPAHIWNTAWWCMLVILVLELQTWIPGAHSSNTKSVSSCTGVTVSKRCREIEDQVDLWSPHTKGSDSIIHKHFRHTCLTHMHMHTRHTYIHITHTDTQHTYSHKAYIYSHSTHTQAHTAFS